MNRKLLASSVLALSLILNSSFAQAAIASPAPKIAERLKKAVESSGFKDGEIGLWVGTTGDAGLETYYGKNATKLLLPASLSKLVTMGGILNTLPPGSKFQTQLLYDAKTSKIDQGALSGAIYLKGGGDPSFVSEDAWALVNDLTRAGVTSVEGDIVVDDSRFDNIRYDEDRQEERVDRAYDAPIGAMSMNWNSVNVYARPGDKPGDPLKVFADVMSPYLKVRNNSRTAAAGKGKTVSVERVTEKGFNGDVIVVNGALAMGAPEAVIYKSISQPDLWAGYNLVEFLRQRGIALKGKVRIGTTPANAVLLASRDSHPLSTIVA
ncbi:MAG: D-alanyl-D-alanine carboxypeptidase/D-alanyl-D-alanine-endopeptidase, partial [Proteobacteria bacterium]